MDPKQYFACERKIRYPSMKAARQAKKILMARGDSGLDAYECEYCGGVHLGHRSVHPSLWREIRRQRQS
jgi:hypothetical protein